VFCEMVEGTFQIIGIQSEEVEVHGGQVTDLDTRVALTDGSRTGSVRPLTPCGWRSS